MFRIICLVCFFMIISSEKLVAEDLLHKNTGLRLMCNITFNNYDGLDEASTTAEIELTDVKHKPGGAVLVRQAAGYQFWAMTHSVQSLGERLFINNFQVAIQHTENKLFMHALSDSSYNPNQPPKHARVSLVDYHPSTLMEKGEIAFECRTLE